MSAVEALETRVSPPAGLVRSELVRRTLRVLSRGGWGNPDVLLVDAPGAPVIVKDFAPRGGVVRGLIGPWLLAREERTYHRLADVTAVPRLIGRLDARALVLEYRPGVLLSRSLRGRLPAAFLGELEAAVEQLHRRGIVHLDLRHRSNVLAGEDGHPVLLDFASALHFDPASRLGRLGLASLAWIDRRALAKWRIRLQ